MTGKFRVELTLKESGKFGSGGAWRGWQEPQDREVKATLQAITVNINTYICDTASPFHIHVDVSDQWHSAHRLRTLLHTVLQTSGTDYHSSLTS